MDILGVGVDNLSNIEILEKVESFLREDKFHQIATVNPEFILTAQKDTEFKNILNNCDLNVADGFGIKCAFWRFGEKLKTRIAGADLMEEILKIAEKNNYKIFLAANSRGLSTWEETSQAIIKRFPKLKIGGLNLDCKNQKEIQNSKFKIQNSENCEIIFANLGAPKQEKFLDSLKSVEKGKIRLALGVGGSFDYLTGKVRRAPVFMRKIGLEWLWRLFRQPNRIRRIFNAVIVFPIKIVLSK